ncbi:MAG: hypothetical protein VR70_14460 [Rhodospirillaceae bacterium BRH_c57]|nr:MAG: hypothetical protein VR70_14460 [Rhodospirillaceae bacterium BRH_c57]
MNKTNDGGAAFPAQPIYGYPGGATITTAQNGMSLRDWFAGQALAGLRAADASDVWSIQDAARVAYAQADAMLIERAKEAWQ